MASLLLSLQSGPGFGITGYCFKKSHTMTNRAVIKSSISIMISTPIRVMYDKIKIACLTLYNRERIFKHFGTSLYKNAYYFMASSLVSSILGFVFWTLATRLYKTEVVGLSSAIVSISGLISLFSNLGFGLGLIRFLPHANEKGNLMINTSLTSSGIVSIAFVLIFLAGLKFWSPSLILLRNDPILFTSFLFFVLVSTSVPIIQCVFIARRSGKFMFVLNTINKSLSILIIASLAFMFNTAFSILISLAIAMFVEVLLAVSFLIPKIQRGYYPAFVIKTVILKEIGLYSIGSHISRVLLQIPPLVFPLVVVNILGNEANAYFSIAWSLAAAIQAVPFSIHNSLFAEGSNQEELIRINVTKSLKLMFSILLPVIAILLLLADIILLPFGHSYSKNGASLLRIVSLAVIPLGINYIYIAIARVGKNIRNMIFITAIIACFTITSSYFFASKLGILGVGLGWLLGQSVIAVPVALYLF